MKQGACQVLAASPWRGERYPHDSEVKEITKEAVQRQIKSARPSFVVSWVCTLNEAELSSTVPGLAAEEPPNIPSLQQIWGTQKGEAE